MQAYRQFQDYTNYVDTSEAMLEFYADQSSSGLEKYYLMIEDWLQKPTPDPLLNKPLVIQAEGGVGKKTLLVKWLEHHMQKGKAKESKTLDKDLKEQTLITEPKKGSKEEDLVVLHFATTGGNNSNYYYAIYRILVKLRQQLNIGQKVELHEEKLRNYFSYWLDVCDQKIKNQIVQGAQRLFGKIIIVLEGIDYFQDRGNRESNIAFWLPQSFPSNVKVIVTADYHSPAMDYFDNLGCPRVTIPADPQVISTMIHHHQRKDLCIDPQSSQRLIEVLEKARNSRKVTSLYVKSFLSCLLPEKLRDVQLNHQSLKKVQECLTKIDFQKISRFGSVEELFKFLLDFWSGCLFQNEQKFRTLVGLLVSTQKGLTQNELLSISRVESEQLRLFITVFRAFLMNFKDLWMIKNDSFRKSIQVKYQFNPVQLGEKIADTLKKTPNSLRKLEEETYQLYTAGNYFRLKEVISDVENFLLLFNPYTKYDLCRYWQKLEERSFDPVIEYNKAIEGFQMHYHPSSDDLFRIITQISRFLKEFSDFETYYTPQFRHPQVIGNPAELQDIGVLGQFRNLALYQCDSDSLLKEGETQLSKQSSESGPKEEELRFQNKLKEMYNKIQEGKHIKKITKIQVEPPTSRIFPNGKKEVQKDKVSQKESQKTEVRVQQLNVEVKSNEESFRQHYYLQVKSFLEKMALQEDQECMALEEKDGEQCEDSDEEVPAVTLANKIKNIQYNKDRSKLLNLPDLKNLYAKMVEQEFQLKQQPPTNYYYKRWIWMQFPWVCMTLKSDYSLQLRKCFASPTSYMSVAEERQFTMQALRIALDAKNKKQAILEKSEQPPMKKKASKKKISPSRDSFDSSYFGKQKSFIKESPTQQKLSCTGLKQTQARKFERLGFSTNSFLSLHNLSKEMEQLKSQGILTKENNASKEQDSKSSLFITAQEGQSRTLNQSQSCLSLLGRKKKKAKETEESFNLGSQPSLMSKSRQGLLPRIKQSVNGSMMKELEELEKNNAHIRKQMDGYLYRNKVLAKRLKELKIIQHNSQNQLKNQKKMEEKRRKIEQIEQKIDRVKQQYAHSLLEHERLDVLIKICRSNKTHNEEHIPNLVQECNNFKKMIKLESQAILALKEKTQQIAKLTRKCLANYCQKVENETQLQQQIALTLRNRNHFDQQLSHYDQTIEQEVEEKRRELLQQSYCGRSVLPDQSQVVQAPVQENTGRNQIQMVGSRMSKKCSQHGNSVENEETNYEQVFRELVKHLDIQSQNYARDPKYLHLLESLSKKKEFQAVIEMRKAELEQLRGKLFVLQQDLETLNRAKDLQQKQDTPQSSANEKEALEKQTNQQIWDMKQNQEQLEKKLQEKKRALSKASELKLSCQCMLGAWYNKLGLSEPKSLSINDQFLQRVEQVKIMNDVQSC